MQQHDPTVDDIHSGVWSGVVALHTASCSARLVRRRSLKQRNNRLQAACALNRGWLRGSGCLLVFLRCSANRGASYAWRGSVGLGAEGPEIVEESDEHPKRTTPGREVWLGKEIIRGTGAAR